MAEMLFQTGVFGIFCLSDGQAGVLRGSPPLFGFHCDRST
jgi:hypothetical protein